MEVKLTYHMICLFKMYTSIVFLWQSVPPFILGTFSLLLKETSSKFLFGVMQGSGNEWQWMVANTAREYNASQFTRKNAENVIFGCFFEYFIKILKKRDLMFISSHYFLLVSLRQLLYFLHL